MSIEWRSIYKRLFQLINRKKTAEQTHVELDVPASSPADVKSAIDRQNNLLEAAGRPVSTSEDMYELAVHHLKMKNFADADVWLRKAADLGDPKAMSLLGHLLSKIGNLQEAIFWWHKAADLGDTSAANSYISQKLFAEARWEEVEHYAMIAYKADVFLESTNALSQSAIALFLKGEDDNAIVRFKLALARDDKFAEAEASWWLAKIYEKRGDQDNEVLFRNRCEEVGGYLGPDYK